MNYEALRNSISSTIKTNGEQRITGAVLQEVLLNMVSSLGQYASYAGIANPGTNPAGVDGNVFYIATAAGNYQHFGFTINTSGYYIISNLSGVWNLVRLPIAADSATYAGGISVSGYNGVELRARKIAGDSDDIELYSSDEDFRVYVYGAEIAQRALSAADAYNLGGIAASMYLTKSFAADTYQPLITATNKLPYSLLSGTPTIPTNNNQLVNGAGYINAAYVSQYLSDNNYAKKSDITAQAVGLGNVQNTAFYTRSVDVNGEDWAFASPHAGQAFSIYAPTSAGTTGQVLVSTGGTPSWASSVAKATSATYATYIGDSNEYLSYQSLNNALDQITDLENAVDALPDTYQPLITATNKLPYSLLSGTPTIPTNNNQLTNGAGYINASYVSQYLADNNYAKKSDITAQAVGLGNVQNTAFYTRSVDVNGEDWAFASPVTGQGFSIYAPTSAGTTGQVLVSTGGTPSWASSVAKATSATYATYIGDSNEYLSYQSLNNALDQITDLENAVDALPDTYQPLITATNKLPYSLLSGTPTSLPASDVYPWAKAATKPTYTFSEITGKPTTLSGYGITDAYTKKEINRGYFPNMGVCDYPLEWSDGYRNGSVSLIESGNPLFSTNRLMFANPKGITIEYSRDNGTTWNPHPLASDVVKTNLVSNTPEHLYLAGTTENIDTIQDKLRVTIDFSAIGLYARCQRILVEVSNTNNNAYVLVEAKLKNGSYKEIVTAPITGWSGWNSYNLYNAVFGSETENSDYTHLRLTFFIDRLLSGYKSFCLSSLYLLGTTIFKGNNIARTGNLYSYDHRKYVFFPREIYATNDKIVLHKGNYASYVPTISQFNTLSGSVAANTTNISNIVNGTTAVGNADKVDGYHYYSSVLYRDSVYLTNNTNAKWYVKIELLLGLNADFQKILINANYNNIQGKLLIEFDSYLLSMGYQIRLSSYNGSNIEAYAAAINGGMMSLYFRLREYTSCNCSVYSTAQMKYCEIVDVSEVPELTELSTGIYIGYKINGTITQADKLATPRTIWGQSFNGTGNVTGAMTGVTTINGGTPITSINIASQSVAQANTANSVAWSGVTGKPTTLAGYGITDAISTSNIGSQTVAQALELTDANGNVTYTVDDITAIDNKFANCSPLEGSASLTKYSGGTFGNAAAKNYTTSVQSGNANLVTSGAVYTAINDLRQEVRVAFPSMATLSAYSLNESTLNCYIESEDNIDLWGDLSAGAVLFVVIQDGASVEGTFNKISAKYDGSSDTTEIAVRKYPGLYNGYGCVLVSTGAIDTSQGGISIVYPVAAS